VGEILIGLRCAKQRERCNRKTFDHSEPHGETANRLVRLTLSEFAVARRDLDLG
jgi:hypothetical protein